MYPLICPCQIFAVVDVRKGRKDIADVGKKYDQPAEMKHASFNYFFAFFMDGVLNFHSLLNGWKKGGSSTTALPNKKFKYEKEASGEEEKTKVCMLKYFYLSGLL